MIFLIFRHVMLANRVTRTHGGGVTQVACWCSIAEDWDARLGVLACKEFVCKATIRSIARDERSPLQPQCATRKVRRGIHGGRSQDIRGATRNTSRARLGGMRFSMPEVVESAECSRSL